MKANELKSKKINLELSDGIHECMFDMNALAEIEDIYGSIEIGLAQFEKKPLGAMRAFVYALLKADNSKITISGAGKLIQLENIEAVVKSISEALGDSMPTVEVTEEIEVEVEGEESQENL